jgi:hypothetical protein
VDTSPDTSPAARTMRDHRGGDDMIERVTAARGVLGYFTPAEVHNEALPDESGAFRKNVKFRNPTTPPSWWRSSSSIDRPCIGGHA